MSESTSARRSKAQRVLALLAVILILVGCVGSGLIKTSFGSVELIEIQIPTKDGTFLHATIFRPKTATAENPAPLVIACHGYSTAQQMQDITAIELSRRGVVVVEMDAYSHGLSSTTIYDNSIDSLNKEARGIIPLVDFFSSPECWVDYIDQSKIGITGHSMGGNSTRNAIPYYGNLELAALEAAALPESSEGETITEEEAAYAASLNPISAAFLQSSIPPADEEKYVAYLCNVGMSYALYDAGAYRTVNGEGDMSKAPEALAFVNSVLDEDEKIDTVEMGRFYGNAEDGTLRVVYNTKTTHEFQYLSKEHSAAINEFFTKSFDLDTSLSPTDQTFRLRYALSGLGLLGLALIIPVFISMLLSTEYFKTIIVKTPKAKGGLVSSLDKGLFWGGWGVMTLVTIFCFVPIVKLSIKILPKAWNFKYAHYFTSTIMNIFVVWCVFIALVGLCIFLLVYNLRLKKQGWTVDDLGLKISAKSLGKVVVLAACVTLMMYNVVFLANFLFHAEFQVWWNVMAKVFTVDKLWMFLQYLPFFFFNMFVLSLTTNSTNRIEGQKHNLLIVVLGNILGALIVFAFSYIYLFSKGHYLPAWAEYRDGVINLIDFVTFTVFATIISRKTFEKTGTIWAGTFINAFIITFLQVGNTSTFVLLH